MPSRFHKQREQHPGLLKAEGRRAGSSRYSQSPDLRHVVEAGDQDAANVVIVEGAVETEEKHYG